MKKILQRTVSLALVVLALFSCTKPLHLKLTTYPVTNLSFTSAEFRGHVVSPLTKDEYELESGFCYSLKPTPTVADFKVRGVVINGDRDLRRGSSASEIKADVKKLETNTTYYVCTYCILANEQVYYGNVQSFTTANGGVELITEVSDVTPLTAVCGGNVISTGAPIKELGVYYSKTPNFTIGWDGDEWNKIVSDSKGLGSFSCKLTKLDPSEIYYVRAYARNDVGTFYGQEEKFITLDGSVKLSTSEVSDIALFSATCGGNIESMGVTITEQGVCYSEIPNPVISGNKVVSRTTGLGPFSCTLSNLKHNTTYYVRAYAGNSVGIYYGQEERFTTLDGAAKLTTSKASNITALTATCGGNVISTGATITERGVCYSKTSNPTINGDKIVCKSTGLGQFSCELSGLIPNTTYYVRAYAKNEAGVFYGQEETFITLDGSVKLSTSSVSEITLFSAVCGGNIESVKGSTITEQGVCYSQTTYPVINGNKVISQTTGLGPFSCTLSDLTHNTTYFVRAYAKNSFGVYYGQEERFTTLDGAAKLTTSKASNITALTATCGGNVISTGATITERGVCYSKTSNPTINGDKVACNTTGLGQFSCELSMLSPNTTYHVRAYAKNETGVYYGQEEQFTTSVGVVKLTTEVTDIAIYSAICGGNILSTEAPLTEIGVCYSKTTNPTIDGNKIISQATDLGPFSCTLSGLTHNTTYYVRAYAKNVTGVYYGQEIEFTTLVKDYFENGKNLGKAICVVGDWDNNTSTPNTPLYWAPVNCGYEEVGEINTDSDHRLGKLYQWGAGDSRLSKGRAREMYYDTPTPSPWYSYVDIQVTSSDKWKNNQGPCPEGWRLPTSQEFKVLSASKNGKYGWVSAGTYAGQSNIYPGAEFFGANSDKTAGTGVFFPAAGKRWDNDGHAYSRGANGYYWSSTLDPEYSFIAYYLYFSSSYLHPQRSYGKADAFSVRCVSEE